MCYRHHMHCSILLHPSLLHLHRRNLCLQRQSPHRRGALLHSRRRYVIYFYGQIHCAYFSFIQQSSHQPQKAFSSSLYASSPLSTPSRTLHYSIPNSTPLDSSFASSTSSFPGSPSPAYNSPLAAYRGKHKTGAGRECFHILWTGSVLIGV